MYADLEKKKPNKSGTVVNSFVQKKKGRASTFQFMKNSQTDLEVKKKNFDNKQNTLNNYTVIQRRPIKLKSGETIQSENYTEDELHKMFLEHNETHPHIAQQIDKAIKESKLFIVDDKGRVRLNPKLLQEDISDEQVFGRQPEITDFHTHWTEQEKNPLNRAHPNWLPPLPKDLPKKYRRAFMEAHDDVYPKVHIATGDEFVHFTSEAGAKGIGETHMMYPSVVAGMQTTHYGRGVYFANISMEELKGKTHGDVAKAIYTRDSEENRRRSESIVRVNMQDKLVLKYSLRGKTPVLMHPTSEPIDVDDLVSISKTSEHVVKDSPPEDQSKPQSKREKLPKPPTAPNKFRHVEDWELARRDFENAKSFPHYEQMSFAEFLVEYVQDI